MLSICNWMIENILNRAIEPTFVPSVHIILCTVVQLQQYETVLQNMLVNHKGVLISELMKTVQYKQFDFQTFNSSHRRLAPFSVHELNHVSLCNCEVV